MSNLPVVPGVPSSAEVDAMKRAMQAVHGAMPTVHEHQAHYSGGSQGRRAQINESQAQPGYAAGYGASSAEDVQQMKNLLERLEQINGKTSLTGEPVESSSGYEAIAKLSESTNSTAGYEVVAAGTRRAAIKDISLQESALALVKLLNKGHQMDSPLVEQVLELEDEYKQAKTQAKTIKERYQRSVDLDETDAANVFKKRHAAVRANALATHDQIKSILASIR
jgi:hypothetical protein